MNQLVTKVEELVSPILRYNVKVGEVNDHYFMARALHLAERGLWTTHPNPRVGCVIVRDGEIIGEGWHQVAGEPHAEILALQVAKERAAGATCYVTLEPCCHQGRTPPCTTALIKAKISRVVIAVSDPNPLVCNKGIEELLKAGIVVDSGVLSQQAEQLNLGFFTRMRYHRPYIRCKLAMSLDGRTAMASGESQWITSQESRRDVQAWRARSSAVMTGSGTVLSDNPLLTVREAELPNYLPKPAVLRQPLRIVVDTHLSTPTTARMLKAPGQTVIFTVSNNVSLRTLLEKAGAHVIYLPSRDRRIDLQAMCHHLAEGYQVNELLLETGATLGGSMLQAGLCDELIIYIAPKLMGNKARGLLNLLNLDYLNQHIPLEIAEIRAIGCDWRVIARPLIEMRHPASPPPRG